MGEKVILAKWILEIPGGTRYKMIVDQNDFHDDQGSDWSHLKGLKITKNDCCQIANEPVLQNLPKGCFNVSDFIIPVASCCSTGNVNIYEIVVRLDVLEMMQAYRDYADKLRQIQIDDPLPVLSHPIFPHGTSFTLCNGFGCPRGLPNSLYFWHTSYNRDRVFYCSQICFNTGTIGIHPYFASPTRTTVVPQSAAGFSNFAVILQKKGKVQFVSEAQEPNEIEVADYWENISEENMIKYGQFPPGVIMFPTYCIHDIWDKSYHCWNTHSENRSDNSALFSYFNGHLSLITKSVNVVGNLALNEYQRPMSSYAIWYTTPSLLRRPIEDINLMYGTKLLNFLDYAKNNIGSQASLEYLYPQQGNGKWRYARLPFITATEATRALGICPYDKGKTLLEEKIEQFMECSITHDFAHGRWDKQGPRTPPGSPNEVLKWGRDMEPFAKRAFEKDFGKAIWECPMLTAPDRNGQWPKKAFDFLNQSIAATPDGILDDGTMIEIKCNFGSKFVSYLNTPPHPASGTFSKETSEELRQRKPHWYHQIQQGLYCTDLRKAYLVEFFGRIEMHYIVVTKVYRNEKYLMETIPQLIALRNKHKGFFLGLLTARMNPNAEDPSQYLNQLTGCFLNIDKFYERAVTIKDRAFRDRMGLHLTDTELNTMYEIWDNPLWNK